MRPVLPQPSPQRLRAATNVQQRCPRCGSAAGLHYVHGHAQCGTCGANVEDCCQGAACDLTRRTDEE
jgi:hypothetical protein